MLQKREVEYCKEVDDVAVLLSAIVADAKAGKPVAEIASGNLQKLVDAVAGVDQIDDEAKANRKVFMQTIGYRTGELADALLPKA